MHRTASAVPGDGRTFGDIQILPAASSGMAGIKAIMRRGLPFREGGVRHV